MVDYSHSKMLKPKSSFLFLLIFISTALASVEEFIFNYSNSTQIFEIPSHVHSFELTVVGASNGYDECQTVSTGPRREIFTAVIKAPSQFHRLLLRTGRKGINIEKYECLQGGNNERRIFNLD